jgi:vancomycin resistance protein YoaR
VNIALLADILDDRHIGPDAAFSVNGTSGPRRCEDGFLPAGTIVRGELVDTCGGGVSQIGTTVVNAAFFAGVTLDQWQPHSFFISRYPAGREATLSYPELDVRFTNDTAGYLVLRASTTPQSVTVSIYGIPRWSEVRADHGERRAPTDFGREERVTTELPPGARRIVQAGGDGFTISVGRTRVPLDAAAEVSNERWTTIYRPQQRIVEVGAAQAAG